MNKQCKTCRLEFTDSCGGRVCEDNQFEDYQAMTTVDEFERTEKDIWQAIDEAFTKPSRKQTRYSAEDFKELSAEDAKLVVMRLNKGIENKCEKCNNFTPEDETNFCSDSYCTRNPMLKDNFKPREYFLMISPADNKPIKVFETLKEATDAKTYNYIYGNVGIIRVREVLDE